MYSKVKLTVKTQNQLTDTFNSNIGVRQGDNLSPTLFNLFINDLPAHIKHATNTDPVTLGITKLNCLMYADDIVLLSTSKAGLQKCIDTLKEFSDEWKLEVNLNKTKALIFNKPGEHIKVDLTYGNQTVECVNMYTYLGLELESSGLLVNAIKKLCEKGLKALYKLYRLTDLNYNIPTMLHIFDHTIVPILLYGAEVWGIDMAKQKKRGETNNEYFEQHLDGNNISLLELKFYKRLLHVRRNTPTIAVRGELGRHPLTIKAIAKSIKYFNQIKSKPENKLVVKALQESISMSNQGQATWYSKLTKLTQTINSPLTSPNTSKSYLKTFNRNTEKNLTNKYEDLWHKQLNSTTSK